MRRILLVLVVLSAVPLAVKLVPAALRDGDASTVALAPSAPPTPAAKATTPKKAPPVRTPQPNLPAQDALKLRPKTASGARVVATGTCGASYYGEGQATASGESFDPGALTAAHKTLPFGTRVKVTNARNDASVVVRINDRGPFVSGRCLDLSTAAMKAIDGVSSGVVTVRYSVLAA